MSLQEKGNALSPVFRDQVSSTHHPLAILRGQLDPKLWLRSPVGEAAPIHPVDPALHPAALCELGIEIPMAHEETEAQRSQMVCKRQIP